MNIATVSKHKQITTEIFNQRESEFTGKHGVSVFFFFFYCLIRIAKTFVFRIIFLEFNF